MAKKITVSALALWTTGVGGLIAYNLGRELWPALQNRTIQLIIVAAAIAISSGSMVLMKDVAPSELVVSKKNSSKKNIINSINLALSLPMIGSVCLLTGFFGNVALGMIFYIACFILISYFVVQLLIIADNNGSSMP